MTTKRSPIDSLNIAPVGKQGGSTVADISFAEGDPLTTAVLMSLFLNRRAYVSDEVDEFGGWWGSQLGDQGECGSRLWTLKRGKHSEGIEDKVFNMASEALQWMIADGVCSDLTIEVYSPNNFTVAMNIRVFRDQKLIKELKFQNLWDMLDRTPEVNTIG